MYQNTNLPVTNCNMSTLSCWSKSFIASQNHYKWKLSYNFNSLPHKTTLTTHFHKCGNPYKWKYNDLLELSKSWHKEKMLVLSNSSFCPIVSIRQLLQMRQKAFVSGKGLIFFVSYISRVRISLSNIQQVHSRGLWKY